VSATFPGDGPHAEALPERNVTGWAILAILLAMALALSLYEAVNRPAPEARTYTGEVLTLRMTVAMRELFRTVPAAESQFESALDPMARELRDPARRDPAAARLYAVVQRERGQEIDSEPLALLAGREEERDQAFAQIYAAERLEPDAAAALAQRLPLEPFTYRMARVHALEMAGDTGARSRLISTRPAVGILVAFGGLGLLLIASAVLWVVFLGMRSAGMLTPLGLPLAQITPLDADRLAMRAAQLIALYLFVSIGVGLARPILDPRVLLVLLPVALVAGVIYLGRMPIFGKRIRLREMGLTTDNLGRNILWGVAGWVMMLPIALAMVIVGSMLFRFLPPPEHPASTALMEGRDPLAVLGIFIAAAVMAPFWEELAFRGAIFQGMARLTRSIVMATLVSSFLFAAIHPQGPAFWLALATIAAMGCALTYFTRSLVPAIVMHAVHNGTLVTLTILIF
jgi:membrane protease YdiL (CAAX protease family)